MLVQPDFSQVQDQVGPGTYKVRIVEAKVDKWAGKDGKPDTHFVNWTLETFAESEDKNNGRKLWHRTPITGGGAFRLQELYKAAIGEDLTGEFDTDMLLGREVEINYVEGKTGYMEVKTVVAIK